MVVDVQAITDKLQEATGDGALTSAVASLSRTSAQIFELLRTTLVVKVGASNVFGDEQLSADVVAETKMWECVNDPATHVRMGASEESPVLKPTTNSSGEFVCFWDPLDGSSIIPCNWSVGTIIVLTTLPSKVEDFKGKAPRSFVKASVIAIHGPRLVVVIGLGSRCLEFTLIEESFKLTNDNLRVSDDASKKFFAPANLRATASHRGYKDLVNDYMLKEYTLRYSGGLVPDVYHMLCKGHGIFVNPTTEKAPAKLRFLYESIPLSFLVESAGGDSYDSQGNCILDLPIEGMDQRTSLVCGCKKEVAKCLEYLKSN